MPFWYLEFGLLDDTRTLKNYWNKTRRIRLYMIILQTLTKYIKWYFCIVYVIIFQVIWYNKFTRYTNKLKLWYNTKEDVYSYCWKFYSLQSFVHNQLKNAKTSLKHCPILGDSRAQGLGPHRILEGARISFSTVEPPIDRPFGP